MTVKMSVLRVENQDTAKQSAALIERDLTLGWRVQAVAPYWSGDVNGMLQTEAVLVIMSHDGTTRSNDEGDNAADFEIFPDDGDFPIPL